MEPPVNPHPDDLAHLVACPDCQARAALGALDVDLDRAWTGVAAVAWAEPPGALRRWAERALGSPGLARALLATPSLVLSWVVASAAILAVGVLATLSTETPWVALLAPALAGIGIAYAYGPGVDPAFELAQTMAVSDRMVLLVRCLAVFGVNAGLGLVASLFTARAVDLTLGWLVPMTLVSALALAAATLARSPNVGVAAALAGWWLVVSAAAAGTGEPAAAVEEAALLPAYAVGAAVCAGLALYATGGRRLEGRRWP